MFFQRGFLESLESVKSYRKKCAEKITDILRERPKKIVGISVHNNKLYMACISLSETPTLEETMRVTLADGDGRDLDILSQIVSVAIAKRGLQNEWTAPVLSDGFCERSLDLPRIDTAEILKAAHFDFLQLDEFSRRDFVVCAVWRDSFWLTAAISADRLEKIRTAWDDSGLKLWGVSFAPADEDTKNFCGNIKNVPSGDMEDGDFRAVYAALTALDAEGGSFFSGAKTPFWRWQAMSLFVVAATLFVLLVTAAADIYSLHAARDELLPYRQQLTLLEKDRAVVGEAKSNLQAAEKINGHIALLAKNDFPCRDALIWLGTINVGGVRITEAAGADGNAIAVAGEAESYEALAKYIEKIESAHDSFATDFELQNAAENDGMINFSLLIKFR